MCAYKKENLQQVFASILNMLSAQGAKKVNYGMYKQYFFPILTKKSIETITF